MKISDLKKAGHLPTLITAFLYFDLSFMIWTLLGPLGAQIGKDLALNPQDKGLMVAVPILAGAFFRIVLGFLVDSFGAKRTGIIAQIIVTCALLVAWKTGLPSLHAAMFFGLFLGIAGASFAVALPQAGRWYPPNMQGLVLGLAGAGNVGVVIDSLLAPRLAAAYGWQNVFGILAIPAVIVLLIYAVFAKDAPGEVRKKSLKDYITLLSEKDAHWFCFFYTISFGGFVGLAGSFVIYFTSEYGLTPVRAGEMAALCTLIGALLRPAGGAIADRIGGIRSLYCFYTLAALAMTCAGLAHSLEASVASLFVASAAFGMANGSVFQLLPQRFGPQMGMMTGLAGCGGGVGGFFLASSLGYAKGLTGAYYPGFFIFAGLCVVAIVGLTLVRSRWRSTWGALSAARI